MSLKKRVRLIAGALNRGIEMGKGGCSRADELPGVPF